MAHDSARDCARDSVREEQAPERDRGAAVAPAPPSRWRRWGGRLAVFVNLSWLLLAGLHWILSGRAFWWGPVDLLPPILFAAVPLLLVAVASLAGQIRWRLLPVPVLALLIGVPFSGLNLSTIWYTPPPAPPGAITVVSWNTMYWDQDLVGGGDYTTADFYRYLRELDADVYLLHEYAHTDFSHPDIFAQVQVIDQLPLLRENFPGYQIVIEGRLLTMSRLPAVQRRAIESTPWLPAEFREPPPAQRDHAAFYNVQTLRTDIVVGDRTVSFYNSHLYQPPMRLLSMQPEPERGIVEVDRFNHAMRTASLRAIREDTADNPHPIVLAGDFNTSPAMGIRRLLPDRLVDHTRALSSIYPTTWSVGGANDERGFAASLWRLDWLLTTPDVNVHRYELRDPAGLSDHRPQQMVLSIDR